MPTGVEIARDLLEEFVRLQDYMLLARKENAIETYTKMKDRYLTLKALLNVCGVNLKDIDKIKDDIMLRPTVIKVEPLENYMLAITFDNGERKQFDVKPYIHGSWYSQLEDSAYFKAVKPDGFTIVWPNGQDICPDALYYSSKII